jgi:hypothetical protein
MAATGNKVMQWNGCFWQDLYVYSLAIAVSVKGQYPQRAGQLHSPE